MKRDNIFWGSALILLGGLFYLQIQGIIPSIFPYLWPIALILFGGWMILGVYWKPNPSEGEQFQVPLQNAKDVHYRFSYGAGRLDVKGGAPMGQALVGSSGVGMEHKSYLSGDRLEVKVDAGPSFIPFLGPSNGVWEFQISNEVPITLDVESGASQLDVDLTNALAKTISLKTGASNSNITMPLNGASTLNLEAGAASINIFIPQGVAGRVRLREGLTALNVDTTRFPQVDSRLYQSPDFDTAANRAEINVEAGLGSITIK